MTYRDDLEALKIRHDTLARELDEVRMRQRELTAATQRQAELEREVGQVREELTQLQEKRKLPLLEDVRIASPCTERWDEMLGDGRARHCLKCDKNVYDVSAMTRKEAEALIAKHDGRLCLRLYKRRDGRVITSDCPVGVRRRRVTRVAALVALGGAAAGGAALYAHGVERAHAQQVERDMAGGQNCHGALFEDDESATMGAHVEPPVMGSAAPFDPPPPQAR